MHLKLVSFAQCPYVQRAVMLLHEKNAAHEVVYIDLANKPDWFLKISPRGKVPVLIADGTPLFESQAICEFLDEVGPEPRMMPADPVLRARDRAWFGYAEDVFMATFTRGYTTDAEKYEKAGATLAQLLTRLSPELGDRQWLSGEGSRFGMADVALAPVFTRLAVFERLGTFSIAAELSNIRAWSARLLARDSVRRSVPDDFEKSMVERLRAQGSLSVASQTACPCASTTNSNC